MELVKSTLHVGLDKPVKLLHVSDTHLVLADEQDSERTRALAKDRAGMSPDGPENLKEHINYAHEQCDLLVHTGDLIDFISHANLEAAKKTVKDDKVFYIAGNHDFSRFVGEAWEDKNYRMNSYMLMGNGFGVPMFFNSRIVGGVNIVGIDNGYYNFEEWQLYRLKKEVKKGLPIILAFHVPLFEQSLYDYHSGVHPGEPTYLCGCDEEHLMPYHEFRAVQQRPDETTMRTIEYIKSEPLIKAILAGHLHFDYESRLTPNLPQFVTGGGYDGCARELTII